MATICFLPVKAAVQVFGLARMFLAIVAIFWIIFTSPSALLPGPIGHLIQTFLPGSNYLNMLVPALSTELVVDMLLLMGVWQNSRTCLVPWLVINILVMLGLSATVLYHLVPIFLPASDTEDTSQLDIALDEINRFLMIIIFNMMLVLQMVNVSGAFKVFVDMGFRRNVSFTKTVDKTPAPKASKVSMYEEPKRKSGVFGEPGLDVEQLNNPNVMVTLEEEGSKRDSCETRETVMFTFDQENFA
eukprot:TRINITY_DN16030_c0_g1_i2.p1 TRINITY_DN16030_c0_g1~~TRINITY_DN16030_c0_g1_i2.p1  ORF type:complete len:255 (+),score=88.09 TRINITY_DN16030_c0_g1_i2:34-765(+)